MAADWETTTGDTKRLAGIATSDGIALDNMTGWTSPEVVIARPAGAIAIVRTATLDLDTAEFSYNLSEEDQEELGAPFSRAALLQVTFRATAPDGKVHSFPEDQPKTLQIWPDNAALAS